MLKKEKCLMRCLPTRMRIIFSVLFIFGVIISGASFGDAYAGIVVGGGPAVVASDGFVGINTSDGTGGASLTNFAHGEPSGYTPTTLGPVNYMHIEFTVGISGANCRMAIFDESNTLVAQTVKFTAGTGKFNVALESEYILTDQNYELHVCAADSGYSYRSLSETGKTVKKTNTAAISDYDVGFTGYVGLNATRESDMQIMIWADNSSTWSGA